jgi:hypothetical protein
MRGGSLNIFLRDLCFLVTAEVLDHLLSCLLARFVARPITESSDRLALNDLFRSWPLTNNLNRI